MAESVVRQPFPFTRPDGSDVEMFIQWKGTEVCMDFHCPCGYGAHIDGGFAYFIGCAQCGAIYEMGTQVMARKTDQWNEGTAIIWLDGITPEIAAELRG